MSEDAITSLTIRLPEKLRERLRRRAKLEERSESQFARFHLGKVLDEAEQEEGPKDAQEV